MTYYLTCILFFLIGLLGVGLVKNGYVTDKWQQILIFFPAIIILCYSFGCFIRGPKNIELPPED